MSEGSGDQTQAQQRPWASPRQQPIKGIVQPRVLPPFGKPTRHTNKLDYIMTTVLKEASKHKHVWPFQKPVDAVTLCIPLYHEKITRPMDLKTIENRLKSTYYTCAQECIDDIETVFQNCYLFNGKEDDVTIMAQNVHEVIKKSLEQAPREEHDMDVYWGKKKKGGKGSDSTSKASTKKNDVRGPSEPPSEAGSEVSAALGAVVKPERKVAGKKTGKRKADSDDEEKTEPHRTKREVIVTKKEVHHPLPPALKPCLKLLNDLFTKKYQEFAWPFYEPVDAETLGLHDYHKIIKEPMDLKTIKSKMESGTYKEVSDFESDIRLMLRNCFLYNPLGDPVHSFGLRFQEVFDKKWAELGDSSSRASSVAPVSAPVAVSAPVIPTQKATKSSAPRESKKEPKAEVFLESGGAKSEDIMQINNALSMIREREEKLRSELSQASLIKEKLMVVKSRREGNPHEPFPEKLINEIKTFCTTPSGQGSSGGNSTARNGRSKKANSVRLYGYEFDSDDEENKPALTYEEKRHLSHLINQLPADQLSTIIAIIQRRESSALTQQHLEDSEVELDFESLGDMCLREMGAFMKTVTMKEEKEEEPKTSKPAASTAVSSVTNSASVTKSSGSTENKNGKKKKNFNMSESSDDETSNSRKRRKRDTSESESSSSSDDDSDDDERQNIPRKSGQPPSTSREWNQSAPPPRMGGMGGQPPMARVPPGVSAMAKNASSNSYQPPKPVLNAPTTSAAHSSIPTRPPPKSLTQQSRPKKSGQSILDTLLPDTFGSSSQVTPVSSNNVESPSESQPENGENEEARIHRMRMEAKRARQREDEGNVTLTNQMEMMAAFEFDNTY